MISQLANLNWMSVLLAFLAYFMLGYVWYTLLFPKQYKISLGRNNEALPNKPVFIIGPAICTAAYVTTSAVLIHALRIQSFGGALEFSLIIGIGFLISNTLNIAINPNFPHPFHYSIITGTYHLIGIMIANTIIISMK
jgi:hypothetical protein